MPRLEYGYFTVEDAEYLLSVLNDAGVDAGVFYAGGVEIPVITVEELDLEALAGSLHGVTDPIGQLKDWLYDRLKELASWFADTVEGIVKSIWDTVVKPVVDTIQDTVSSIWDYIQQIPGTTLDMINWLKEQIANVYETVYDNIVKPLMEFFDALVDKISDAISTVSDFIKSIVDTVSKVLSDIKDTVWKFIHDNIIEPLSEAFSTLTDYVKKTIDTVLDFLTKTLPDQIKGFVDFVTDLFGQVSDFVSKNIIKPLADFFAKVFDQIQAGIKVVVSFFTEAMPKYISDAVKTIMDFAGKAWDVVEKYVIEPLMSAVDNIIKYVSSGIEAIKYFFTKTFPGLVSKVYDAFKEISARAWDIIREYVIEPITKAVDTVVGNVSRFVDVVKEFVVETLPRQIENIAKLLESLPKKVWDSLVVAGKTIWEYITELGKSVQEGFSKVSEALSEASKYLYMVGKYLTGFVNSIIRLPELFRKVFEDVIGAITSGFKTVADVFSSIGEALKKPYEWISKNILEPLVNAVKGVWNAIVGGLEWLWGRIVDLGRVIYGAVSGVARAIFDAVKGAINAVIDALSKAAKWFYDTYMLPALRAVEGAVKQVVYSVLEEALKSKGEKGEFWVMLAIPSYLLPYFLGFTAPSYIIEESSDLIKEIDAEIDASPLGAGVKARLKAALGKMVKWIGSMGTDVSKSMMEGFMIGIGLSALDPFKYVVRPVAKNFFTPVFEKTLGVDMFFELPGRSDILKFMRLALPEKILSKIGVGRTEGVEFKPYMKWEDAKQYTETLLKVYGLPDKFTELYKLEDTDFYLKFVDRFGKSRMIPLSPVYELMTHSELLRMTQKDIFPSPRVAMGVASLRGWAPDLTVMSYLLTFKYPSFEKLWKFYMRSTAGMLWFNPPDYIKNMFANEAKQIGAGVPVAPLDLQRSIRTGDNLKAFETAINTYFKWLEYSNFSWFTPDTTVNGVNIGREIYSKLGGWTADSWIMADVAADIPGKIDLRWMSRYGIFMWMAEKLESAGVSFESYTPLVEVVPKLLESGAGSKITVSLEWFSKLLQATGLHPAWVPITTVAENIMVISDEMTLLRTGWINMFKEGMLDVGTVENALAGMLKVSYRVGYWNPETKTWSKGYITLPVRWLPHERRLLELRALMDRILDLYREFERYVGSGVRTLAITAEEGLKLLAGAVGVLNEHYRRVSKEITGQELSIVFDEEYARIRMELLKSAQAIEVKERLRYWWFRVSGWILYRIASGYVSKEDIEKVFNVVKETIPLFPEEIEGYIKISEAIMGIAVKENIPTPSQLATLAEIIPIPDKLIDYVFEKRNIPEVFRPIWRDYIVKKPLKDDFNRVLTVYYRAKRYGVSIPPDVEKRVFYWFEYFNVSKEERELRDLAAYLEALIDASKEYLPTPSMLATLNEYITIPDKLVEEVFEKKKVPVEWREVWYKYIMVKPIKGDYKSLINVARRAYVIGVLSEEEWKAIIREAEQYGFKKKELEIYTRIADIYELIESSKAYIPTPSMLASMSEYIEIPMDMVKYVFEKRRVPAEWRELWLKYIMVKPLADDVRYLLSSYLKAKYYGVSIPPDVEKRIRDMFKQYGITDKELEIRELGVWLESLRETLPTLSQLATMAEYVEVPISYIRSVLEERRVEKTFADLWIRYIQARSIYGEVRGVVSVYRRMYEYFTVPRDITEKVAKLMRQGGWTEREIEIFNLELGMRKAYRVMAYLIPTIRGFVGDARYLPEWEQLLNDLLKARGIDVAKYEKQIAYYKKLIRNRMVWRQIAWYRNRVVYAYATGVIDRDTAKKKLEALKKYGLSDEEIELILDGMELYKLSMQAGGY